MAKNKKTKKPTPKPGTSFDKDFINNDHLSTLLPKDKDKPPVKAKSDKPSGLDVITKALSRDKPKATDKPPDTGIKTHSLIRWVCQAYDTQVLDRANGTVYHVLVGSSHKKLIKAATFENKSGVFFGGMLNSSMSDLATKDNGFLTVLHTKSNVYKVVKPTLTHGQLALLQTAIVKVIGNGKLAIGAMPDTK